MKLSRRTLLQAAAATPVLAMLPDVGASAVVGPMVAGVGRELPATGLTGISLSWTGAPHGPVARVRGVASGRVISTVDVAGDHGHGPETADGRTHSDAVMVPGADRYLVEPLDASGAADLRLHPIERETRDPTRPGSPPTLVSPTPGLEIITRESWSYRGRLDTVDCVLGSSVFGLGCRSDVGLRHAVVHHTVHVNEYAEADVPELLRGIQRFHIETRGWDDIAYNFVIDRFGRIWHAREGDITEPITGGHTTGLNAESVGVAVLGTFTSLDPGQPVVDALATLLGGKLSLHGVDPLGMTSVRSAGGDYAEPGEMVLLHNISGHRDNQQTSCPGSALYNRLPEIRAAAAEHVSVFGSVTPHYHPDRIDIDGWAIDRLDPTAPVAIDVLVDGVSSHSLVADTVDEALDPPYPDAGPSHGFAISVPITLDTTGIEIIARTADDRTASLMDLTLFATFIDVEPHRFFAPGIYFLRQEELTTGTLPGLFEPMDEMNRAQMATFLHRFMQLPEPTTANPFTDVDRDTWYTAAVDWLAERGITTGTSPTLFSPGDIVTRGQMATFLWRLCGRLPAPPTSPFTDLPAGSYYDEAVRWMYDLGITVGTSPTTYSPDDAVTRGEIATFLHRLAATPEAWTEVAPPFDPATITPTPA